MPEGYDRSEIQKLLFPDEWVVKEGEVEVPWLFFVKPWKASPGLSVAVLETVTYGRSSLGRGADDKATTLYIAVFGGGMSGAKADIKARCQMDGVAERHVKDLDLAPYRLAPDKLAFGVRTWMNWPLPGGGANNEYLLLFILDGQALRKVWATLMMSWRMANDGFFDDGAPIKAENGEAASATITVLRTATHGLHDLRKSLRGKPSVTYRWNGESYAARGRDPVANVNDWPEAKVE